MLRDVAVSVHGLEQAEEVRRQARLVVAEMSDELLPEGRRGVEDAAARVDQVLVGEVADAYADRSGELRSV